MVEFSMCISQSNTRLLHPPHSLCARYYASKWQFTWSLKISKPQSKKCISVIISATDF